MSSRISLSVLSVMLALLVGAAPAALAGKAIFKIDRQTGIRSFEPHGMFYHYQIVKPAVIDTLKIARLMQGPVVADSTVSFSAAQSAKLDFAITGVPRAIDVTVCDVTGANNNGIKAGTVTITGKNWKQETITCDYSISENTAGTLDGTKAFASISSVLLPVQDDKGARFSFGLDADFGLPFTTTIYPVVYATAAGTRETTFPTVAMSATALESNIIAFSTAPDSSKSYNVLLWMVPVAATDARGKW